MTALSGFKSLGTEGWVGFFSNIFYDRDIKSDAPRGERFTLEALKEASDWMNDGHLPELWFWHLENMKLGKATKTYMVGPFIIAEGVWNDDDVGRKAQEYFDTTEKDWRMSHGFGYKATDRKQGEYTRFRPHEVTVLPEKWAANPITIFAEDSKMTGIVDDLKNALVDLLHVSEDEAKVIAEEGMKAAKKSTEDGELVGTKDADAEDAATESAEVEETAASDEADPTEEGTEDVPDDELALALVDALTELNEERSLRAELTKQVGELAKQVETLQTEEKGRKDALDARIKALEEAEQERIAMLPKAVKKALSERAKTGDAVDKKEAAKDIDQRESGLNGDPSFENDALGWMMKQAGVRGAPTADPA